MKKVLIITYYWPPSGGSGVQRWLKFAKYLPEFGWQPIILTPKDPAFGLKDQSLLPDISPDLEVIKIPIWEPLGLIGKLRSKNSDGFQQGIVEEKDKTSLFQKFLVWVRGNLFVPDPKIMWVRPATKAAMQFIKSNQIDVVVTTGPPHSIHLIGRNIKRKVGINWLADFRDTWSQWGILDELRLGARARKKQIKLEKGVLKEASAVIAVSRKSAQALNQLCDRRIETITNGFDHADFDNVAPIKSRKFVIGYFGLLNSFRNPTPLLTAIKEACEQDPALSKEVQLKLFGTIIGKLKTAIDEDGFLRKIVEINPPISHNEVLRQYQRCSVLFGIVDDTKEAMWHLPGKMFEYMGAKKEILMLGKPDSDAGRILEATGSGSIYDPSDVVGIREFIIRAFQDYKAGRKFKGGVDLEKFTRKSLAKGVADILDQL